MIRLLKYSYLLPVLTLFFYSFTQVDLGLVFSKYPGIQSVLFSFQTFGHMNRSLSTIVYILIVLSLFAYYIYFLRQAFLKKLKIKQIWSTIILSALVLTFSYNAFSYDLFNYIFDAKIITYYHLNPYVHKALDFPGDPMLSFMQWTHRTYPYGPLWLALTTPLSFLGHNIFLLTFFLFKLLTASLYLGSSYLVWKIAEKISPENKIFYLIAFALNPLVLIELLVSAHNEGAMIFFALLALYFFLKGNKIFALFAAAISSQIKIPTSSLIPVFAAGVFPQFNINPYRVIWLCIGVMTVTLFYVLTKIELQPWYFLWILPFACLTKPNKYILSLILGLSLGMLLRYTPFLYTGNWDGLAPQIKGTVSLLTPAVFLIATVFLDKSKLWKKF